MKFGLEAKVGIFVVACFALVAAFTMRAGGISFGESDGYEVTAYVDDAAGLTADSAVMHRGVKVGMVQQVQLDGDKVAITMRMNEAYTVPGNVQFVVRSSGFLGEKYAEIVTVGESTASLKDGDTITDSAATTDFDQIGTKFGAVADDLKEITAALKDIIASQEGKAQLKDTVSNVHDSTQMIRDLIATNEARVNRIVGNVEDLTVALRQMSVENRENIDRIVNNILLITDELRAQSIDPNSDLRKSVNNIRNLTTDMQTTVDNLNEITDKINKGEGTVGALINDNTTVKNLNNALTGLENALGGMNKFSFHLNFRGEYLGERDDTRGMFTLKIRPSDEKYYLAGIVQSPGGTTTVTETYENREYISGTGGTNGDYAYTERTEETTSGGMTFILQYARSFWNRLDLRIGLMESTFGFGADLHLVKNERLSLNLDAFDFPGDDQDPDAHLKAGLTAYPFKHVYLTGGYDDFLNDETKSWFAGAGLAFEDNDLKYLLGSLPLPN